MAVTSSIFSPQQSRQQELMYRRKNPYFSLPITQEAGLSYLAGTEATKKEEENLDRYYATLDAESRLRADEEAQARASAEGSAKDAETLGEIGIGISAGKTAIDLLGKIPGVKEGVTKAGSAALEALGLTGGGITSATGGLSASTPISYGIVGGEVGAAGAAAAPAVSSAITALTPAQVALQTGAPATVGAGLNAAEASLLAGESAAGAGAAGAGALSTLGPAAALAALYMGVDYYESRKPRGVNPAQAYYDHLTTGAVQAQPGRKMPGGLTAVDQELYATNVYKDYLISRLGIDDPQGEGDVIMHYDQAPDWAQNLVDEIVTRTKADAPHVSQYAVSDPSGAYRDVYEKYRKPRIEEFSDGV